MRIVIDRSTYWLLVAMRPLASDPLSKDKVHYGFDAAFT